MCIRDRDEGTHAPVARIFQGIRHDGVPAGVCLRSGTAYFRHDENYFKVVDEPLKWICQDDPIEPDCYALQQMCIRDSSLPMVPMKEQRPTRRKCSVMINPWTNTAGSWKN